MSREDALAVERTAVGDSLALSITFERPRKHNALPLATVEALIETLDGVDPDEVDAVVLRGAGEHFCAGVDLVDVSGGERLLEAGERMHDVVDATRSCPVPVVAAVRGYAFGAGFVFCLGADVVLAAETATFGLQEVRLDVPVAGYVTTLLPRTVGESRAREWLLTGREVPAPEAERAGFVTRSVSGDDLDEAVADAITGFEPCGDSAVRLLKERLAAPTGPDGESEWDARARRELADMQTATDEGETAARLAAFGEDQ